MSQAASRLLPLVVALLAAACGPRLVHDTIAETEQVVVKLRRTLEKGEVKPLGRQHPLIVSDVRIAHILASFTHERTSGAREPTVRSEDVYPLAEALALAFERAGPDDDVVAAAIWTERRLGVFSATRATSFTSYVVGDDMVFEFFEIDVPVRKSEGRSGSDEYSIPEKPPEKLGWSPIPGQTGGGFKLIAGQAQTTRGERGVAVAWRDPYYRKPVSLRSRYGQTRRRTIIMEMPLPAEEVPAPAPPPHPDTQSDAQLQALDELEAARRAGFVTESEYRRRLRLIKLGQLEQAGYPIETP